MSGTVSRAYRVSAMYEAHRALGATFTDDTDWRIPHVYTRADDEARRAMAGVGLADASACGKLLLQGERMEALLAKAAAIEPIAVATAARVRVDGAGILALRLAGDELLLLLPLADTAAVREVVGSAASALGCAHLADLTSGLAVLDLIGPRAPELLARVSPLDLALPVLGVAQGEVARVHATVVRLDRPAGPVFRLLVARECGAFVWEAAIEAGHDLGLVPVGAAARAALDGAG